MFAAFLSPSVVPKNWSPAGSPGSAVTAIAGALPFAPQCRVTVTKTPNVVEPLNEPLRLAQFAPPPSMVIPGTPASRVPELSSAGCVSVSDGNWPHVYVAGLTKETFAG